MQPANSGQRWADLVEEENCGRRVVQLVCWLDTCICDIPTSLPLSHHIHSLVSRAIFTLRIAACVQLSRSLALLIANPYTSLLARLGQRLSLLVD